MTEQTSELTKTPEPGRIPSAIDAVADAYTAALLELDPSLATSLGMPGHETEYPDFSPAGHEEFAAAAREALAALDGLEPADDVDAVTLDAMRERLGLQLEIHESGWDLADLNNIASPSQDIRAIFDLMPTDTAGQWEQHRGPGPMSPLPSTATSCRCVPRGRTAGWPRPAAGAIVIEQSHQARRGGRLLREAGRAAPRPRTARFPRNCSHRLGAGAAAAAAWRTPGLPGFLESELLPVAPEKDAVGRDRYALASRAFLGATVDLEETYAWGVQELDRLIAEQEAGGRADPARRHIEEAKEILNNDPAPAAQGHRRPAGLDAGTVRQGRGGARRRPLRHPGRHEDAGVHDRPDR